MSQEPSQFECKDCGKQYRSQEVLNRHRNTHVGSLRYVCYYCNVAFHRRDILSRHFKRVHTVGPGEVRATRTRCARACDRCRKHKIKCDGQDPCSSCKTNNESCTFKQNSKRASFQITPVVEKDKQPSDGEESAEASDEDREMDNASVADTVDTVGTGLSHESPAAPQQFDGSPAATTLHDIPVRPINNLSPEEASFALQGQNYHSTVTNLLARPSLMPNTHITSSDTGLENIWSESSDWSWVFDDSFRQMFAANSPSMNNNHSLLNLSISESSTFPLPFNASGQSKEGGDTTATTGATATTNNKNKSNQEVANAESSIAEAESVLEELMYHAMAKFTHAKTEHQSMEAPIWYQLSQKVEASFGLHDWRDRSQESHIFYHFMKIYFHSFHLLYSFFWRQGFDFASVSPILCLTLGMVGSMFDTEKTSIYGQRLHEKLSLTLAGTMLLVPERSDGHVPLLVSMLVTQMIAIYSANPRKLHYAQQISGVLVSQARRLNLFNNPGTARGDLARWIRLETRRRIAFAIFLNESYLSILLGSRPLVSAEEMNVSLPCRDEPWTYVGPDWYASMTKLMQADEQNSSVYFSDLYRILLEEHEQLCYLDAAGYRMLLLALQANVWRFSHDCEISFRLCGSESPYEAKKKREDTFLQLPNSNDHLTFGARRMTTFLNDLERTYNILRKWRLSFSANLSKISNLLDRQMALSSKITYHSYYMALCAPINVLHTIADNVPKMDQLISQRRLASEWARSQQARTALFHVKEIWQTLVEELALPRSLRANFNIASLIGLHHSSVIIWVCSASLLDDDIAENPEDAIILGDYAVRPANSGILLESLTELLRKINPKFAQLSNGAERAEMLSRNPFVPINKP